MFSCKDVTGRASDHLEGRLSAAERLALGAHLALCVHCRRYLRQFGRTVSLLRRLPPEAPSDPATEDQLIAEFRRSRRGVGSGEV